MSESWWLEIGGDIPEGTARLWEDTEYHGTVPIVSAFRIVEAMNDLAPKPKQRHVIDRIVYEASGYRSVCSCGAWSSPWHTELSRCERDHRVHLERA